MMSSISYNKLEMAQFSYKKSLSLAYIFMFLCFESSYCPDMHKCYHNLSLKILDLPMKVT